MKSDTVVSSIAAATWSALIFAGRYGINLRLCGTGKRGLADGDREPASRRCHPRTYRCGVLAAVRWRRVLVARW